MNNKILTPEKSISDEAAIYQIQVKGKITDILIHSVDDMQIRQNESTEAVSLVGWLPDQSALLGLLNTLNDIRYAIISVRILTKDN
ncbi:hypothetical protein [Maribellus sediminis]|uniref:hypothetical protein n=1 Tax=Maribellus sediminis TaxID=2696285 RepID=UPI00142FA492|nr:hypothetical protein [Maribellus sediminis]